MKFVIKLLLFVIVLGVAGPYLLKGPEGTQQLLRLKDQLLQGDWSQLMSDYSLTSSTTNSSTNSTPSNDPASGQQWIQWSSQQTALQPDQLTREQLAVLDIQAQANIYYRWQDDNGVWQFSELPNRNTLNLVVRTDPDANVLQGLDQEQIDIAFGRQPAATNPIVENNPLAQGKELEPSLPLPTTVPVSEIPQLIEQAKQVQELVNQRMQHIDMTTGSATPKR